MVEDGAIHSQQEDLNILQQPKLHLLQCYCFLRMTNLDCHIFGGMLSHLCCHELPVTDALQGALPVELVTILRM
jgi:hypothetical protein